MEQIDKGSSSSVELSSKVFWTITAVFYLVMVVYMAYFAPQPTGDIFTRAAARVLAGLLFGWLLSLGLRALMRTRAFGGRKLAVSKWTLVFAALLMIHTEWFAATQWH